MDEGLSNAALNAIFQDSRGFMWFATRDGLIKYDGYTITIYKHLQLDSLSFFFCWVRKTNPTDSLLQQSHLFGQHKVACIRAPGFDADKIDA